jgi:hypothetical protein
MEYIYVDTAGDLDPKGTQYFIVGFLALKDKKILEKIVENCRQKFAPDELELKFGKSEERLRKALLDAGDFQKEFIPAIEQLGKEIYRKRLLSMCCKNSKADKCLQAVDFVVGAVLQAYEKENTIYFDLIGKKIVWHVIV